MLYPSFHEFQRWQRKFNVVPLCLEISNRSHARDPYPLFSSLEKNKKTTFFLDSFNAEPLGRYSYFPLTPPQREFLAQDQNDFPEVWKSLKNFSDFNCGPKLAFNFPPFYGGLAGILSYDCGRFFEKGWNGSAVSDPLKLPLLHFGLYHDLACFDHKTGRIFLFSCLPFQRNRQGSDKEIYQNKKKKLLYFAENLSGARVDSWTVGLNWPTVNSGTLKVDQLRRAFDNKRFIQSVHKIKNYIAAGDIYQANLSQRIEMQFKEEGLDFFERLRRINPSPYSCFFRFPGYAIASCSPELLLKKRGRVLETRPIAGTRPRGTDLASDAQLSRELLLNEKERAEHIMLLDLERNDLGKVCKHGSVKVREKMVVERYSHVMHIVSSVRGKLKEGENVFSALAAVFPGGTITGCPKVRCMQILDELEPSARGPFFGSAGWISYQGAAEFNLLIRTAVIKNRAELQNKNTAIPYSERPIRKKIYFQVGSGIVADSDPELEYQESLHKAQALLEAFRTRKVAAE